MKVIVSKALAATQQLDVAIELLFADRNPLAVRTLAAAAHCLLSDLVETANPGKSWREVLIVNSKLPRKKALEVLNGASNFLKHADKDPNAQLSFEEEENDHLIFFATLECGTLGHSLSYTMQAFQIWYLANYPDHVDPKAEPVIKAVSAFPNLTNLEREHRLQLGAEFVSQVLAKYAKPI